MVQTSGLLRLAGMRDWEEEACGERHAALEALQQVLRSHGYAWLDTPLLEPLDLFLRKSGAELISRLYSFTEPGGQAVALRPEFTPAVIRHFLEVRPTLSPPVRWYYMGPVFRFDPSPGVPRQFTQVGAELLGAAGPAADAEILALARACVLALGGEGFALSLGHMGCLGGLLASFGLSPRAQGFLLAGIPLLRGEGGKERLLERAAGRDLLRPPGPVDAPEVLAGVLAEHPEEGEGPLFGGRTRGEILARLVRKARSADDPAAFRRAVAFLADLVRIQGEPGAALAEVRSLLRHWGLDPSPLRPLEALLEALEVHTSPRLPLVLDMGLVRDIAYYTGFLFEITHRPTGQGIAGGGRYDGLVGALGQGEDVPALGFALSLERLMAVSPPPAGRHVPQRMVVAPATPEAYPDAVGAAEALRREGKAVEVSFTPLARADVERLLRQGRPVIIVSRGGGREHLRP